ncbi:hypothetical protein, partial [Burkholderia multivorans]|uniref:hypothetical protein n=1 Tax=Burkholderia multivorans TaxID=87883 RepID=UPI00287063EE
MIDEASANAAIETSMLIESLHANVGSRIESKRAARARIEENCRRRVARTQCAARDGCACGSVAEMHGGSVFV